MPRLGGDFDRNVFINCPFDADFRPILEAILFCLIDSGFEPRIASERLDSGEVRLDKIEQMIRESRYSIHDLSRLQAGKKGEYARLNMPFELGLDYGLAQGGRGRLRDKRLLVIAQDPYKYQAALSDIAGWDIGTHRGEFDQAIRQVRNWLAATEGSIPAASQIVGNYFGFQEWDYERLLARGWDDLDIQERPTPELLDSMREWIVAGRPMTF